MIADEVSLEVILEKIYFEAYCFDDLKEYVIPALRKVPNIDSFFNILYDKIKKYNEVIPFLLWPIIYIET